MILGKRPDIERFLGKPDPVIRASLIYGRDTGVVRDRGHQLAAKLVPGAAPTTEAPATTGAAKATAADDGVGYRLTAHVKRYYETTQS